MENNKQRKEEGALVESVFERIEKEQVTPTPRWQFLLKDYVFWGAWGLSVLFGAGAIAATLFVFRNIGWSFYSATHDNLVTFIVSTAPYLWIIALIVFIGIGYYNVRHTKRGYRYSFSLVLFLSISISVVGGTALHAIGVGALLDEGLERRFPGHRSIVARQADIWMQPEKGLLIGRVEHVSTNTPTAEIRGFDGSLWRIDTSDLRTPDLRVFADEEVVRIIGVPQESDELLHACFVFPWNIERGFRGIPQFHGKISDRTERSSGRKEILERFAERNGEEVRSSVCRDVRPYDSLLRLQRR